MGMYAGDEDNDDDVTSGPIDDIDDVLFEYWMLGEDREANYI